MSQEEDDVSPHDQVLSVAVQGTSGDVTHWGPLDRTPQESYCVHSPNTY